MCPHSAPVHLHIYMSERRSHSGAGWSTRERFDTFKSLYYKQLLSIYFPKLHFSGKIIVLWFFYYSYDPLEVPQRPFPWHLALFCFPPLPPCAGLGHAYPLALLPRSTTSLPHLSLSLLSFTLHTNRWPTAPAASLLSHDPLTSSCFSCWKRQLSKCLCEELLSFSLSPDQFPKRTLWHVLKYRRWRAK